MIWVCCLRSCTSPAALQFGAWVGKGVFVGVTNPVQMRRVLLPDGKMNASHEVIFGERSFGFGVPSEPSYKLDSMGDEEDDLPSLLDDSEHEDEVYEEAVEDADGVEGLGSPPLASDDGEGGDSIAANSVANSVEQLLM